MKKILLTITTLLLHSWTMHPMIGGVAAEEELLSNQIQRKAAQLSQSPAQSTTPSTTLNQNCPPPTSTTSTALPSFIINMYNAANSLINTYTFTTNSNFLVSNALLIIHIFPPSNNILNKSVSLASSDSSYAVMYTLKSLDGTMIQKALQYINTATASTSAIMIQKGRPEIPTSISIAMVNPATTGSAATSSIISSPATSPFTTFLPNMSQHTTMTKQRIFNGVSPMSQKFLISVDSSNNISASQISGIFDVDNSSDTPTLASSLLTNAGSAVAITPTSGTTINPISVTISDDNNTTQTIKFSGKTIPFNQQDLLNGLACNIHIFPPSSGGSNYIIIATLRTLDGLKLRKQIIQEAGFSPIPSQLSITHGSTPILSTTFLNSDITMQAMTLVSPINLRCIIQKMSTSQNFTVSII